MSGANGRQLSDVTATVQLPAFAKHGGWWSFCCCVEQGVACGTRRVVGQHRSGGAGLLPRAATGTFDSIAAAVRGARSVLAVGMFDANGARICGCWRTRKTIIYAG